VASCDRGDIGGLSTAVGPPSTDSSDGLPSVFVYDGYPGGAGFAEQGFRRASTWLGATAAAIEACECPSGCPSWLQSPKCGSGNEPLDKAGAVRCVALGAHCAGSRERDIRMTTDPSTVDIHASGSWRPPQKRIPRC